MGGRGVGGKQAKVASDARDHVLHRTIILRGGSGEHGVGGAVGGKQAKAASDAQEDVLLREMSRYTRGRINNKCPQHLTCAGTAPDVSAHL